MFGYHCMENFNYPYMTESVAKFWRRWHISLSQWFRDYIYIPLGGSRTKSKGRVYINMLAVWLATGIWHGAAWNFVVWGLGFFILFAIVLSFPVVPNLRKRFEGKEELCRIYDAVIGILVIVLFIWAITFAVVGQNNPFAYANF